MTGGEKQGTSSPVNGSETASDASHQAQEMRWAKAESRISQLILHVQPSHEADERRMAVWEYVQNLIQKCFECRVFMFGSVPLKTYLPDGDIDMTAFSRNLDLKDSWAEGVKRVLEAEESKEDAKFRVKEVQYIHAEVKLVKCLVENIVVDISFNQLGGLCTLCFLEQVDRIIGKDHLFKRSVILIKAWCYYESRILGAHHGLISTYGLETLVLYIFHVFHSQLNGPLQVLLKFLEFFSTFDWDNYCLSLKGPIPIANLPSMLAETPIPEKGKLLLTEAFLAECASEYSAIPQNQDAVRRVFTPKFMNVVDPLLQSNNLGRSVNKANFFRIRSALSYGAKKLGNILRGPEEVLVPNLDRFFINTWDRNGNKPRPDISPEVSLNTPPNLIPNLNLASLPKLNLVSNLTPGLTSSLNPNLSLGLNPTFNPSLVNNLSQTLNQNLISNLNLSLMPGLSLNQNVASKQQTITNLTASNVLSIDQSMNPPSTSILNGMNSAMPSPSLNANIPMKNSAVETVTSDFRSNIVSVSRDDQILAIPSPNMYSSQTNHSSAIIPSHPSSSPNLSTDNNLKANTPFDPTGNALSSEPVNSLKIKTNVSSNLSSDVKVSPISSPNATLKSTKESLQIDQANHDVLGLMNSGTKEIVDGKPSKETLTKQETSLARSTKFAPKTLAHTDNLSPKINQTLRSEQIRKVAMLSSLDTTTVNSAGILEGTGSTDYASTRMFPSTFNKVRKSPMAQKEYAHTVEGDEQRPSSGMSSSEDDVSDILAISKGKPLNSKSTQKTLISSPGSSFITSNATNSQNEGGIITLSGSLRSEEDRSSTSVEQVKHRSENIKDQSKNHPAEPLDPISSEKQMNPPEEHSLKKDQPIQVNRYGILPLKQNSLLKDQQNPTEITESSPSTVFSNEHNSSSSDLVDVVREPKIVNSNISSKKSEQHGLLKQMIQQHDLYNQRVNKRSTDMILSQKDAQAITNPSSHQLLVDEDIKYVNKSKTPQHKEYQQPQTSQSHQASLQKTTDDDFALVSSIHIPDKPALHSSKLFHQPQSSSVEKDQCTIDQNMGINKPDNPLFHQNSFPVSHIASATNESYTNQAMNLTSLSISEPLQRMNSTPNIPAERSLAYPQLLPSSTNVPVRVFPIGFLPHNVIPPVASSSLPHPSPSSVNSFSSFSSIPVPSLPQTVNSLTIPILSSTTMNSVQTFSAPSSPVNLPQTTFRPPTAFPNAGEGFNAVRHGLPLSAIPSGFFMPSSSTPSALPFPLMQFYPFPYPMGIIEEKDSGMANADTTQFTNQELINKALSEELLRLKLASSTITNPTFTLQEESQLNFPEKMFGVLPGLPSALPNPSSAASLVNLEYISTVRPSNPASDAESDPLSGNFDLHLKNLKFGKLCQNPNSGAMDSQYSHQFTSAHSRQWIESSSRSMPVMSPSNGSAINHLEPPSLSLGSSPIQNINSPLGSPHDFSHAIFPNHQFLNTARGSVGRSLSLSNLPNFVGTVGNLGDDVAWQVRNASAVSAFNSPLNFTNSVSYGNPPSNAYSQSSVPYPVKVQFVPQRQPQQSNLQNDRSGYSRSNNTRNYSSNEINDHESQKWTRRNSQDRINEGLPRSSSARNYTTRSNPKFDSYHNPGDGRDNRNEKSSLSDRRSDRNSQSYLDRYQERGADGNEKWNERNEGRWTNERQRDPNNNQSQDWNSQRKTARPSTNPSSPMHLNRNQNSQVFSHHEFYGEERDMGNPRGPRSRQERSDPRRESGFGRDSLRDNPSNNQRDHSREPHREGIREYSQGTYSPKGESGRENASRDPFHHRVGSRESSNSRRTVQNYARSDSSVSSYGGTNGGQESPEHHIHEGKSSAKTHSIIHYEMKDEDFPPLKVKTNNESENR